MTDAIPAALPTTAVTPLLPHGYSRLKFTVAVTCWVYLGLVALCWLMIRFLAERWTPATVLLFGPKWLIAIPALPLAVVAAFSKLRAPTVAVTAAACIVCFPVMGFSLRLHHSTPAGGKFRLRVLSNSVHGIYPDGPAWAAFAEFYKDPPADVVAMQEWGGGPAGQSGWDSATEHVMIDGELKLWSRFPLRRLGPAFKSPGWSQGAAVAYEVQTPAGPVTIINLHLASPHIAFSAAARLKPEADAMVQNNSNTRESQLAALVLAAHKAGDKVILAGDFNLPAEDIFFRDQLSGFNDAFKQISWGFGWTYATRYTVARIDHILTGSAWTCRSFKVEHASWSPHKPIIAELELGNPGR